MATRLPLLVEKNQREIGNETTMNGKQFDLSHVASGVPRGSVLGPVLFLVFINDITSKIDSNVRYYADDCLVYRNGHYESDHKSFKLTLTAYLTGVTHGE